MNQTGNLIGFAIALGLVLLIIVGVFFQEEEPEGYSAYADSSIFKDGNVNIDFIGTHCTGSKDSTVWKCHADLVFNNRAVGFVNFQEIRENQEVAKK